MSTVSHHLWTFLFFKIILYNVFVHFVLFFKNPCFLWLGEIYILFSFFFLVLSLFSLKHTTPRRNFNNAFAVQLVFISYSSPSPFTINFLDFPSLSTLSPLTYNFILVSIFFSEEELWEIETESSPTILRGSPVVYRSVYIVET